MLQNHAKIRPPLRISLNTLLYCPLGTVQNLCLDTLQNNRFLKHGLEVELLREACKRGVILQHRCLVTLSFEFIQAKI